MNGRIPFDHVQGVAVKIARPVEPGVWCEARHVDHQTVALPVTDRVPHVRLTRVRVYLVQVNDPLGIGELEDHHDLCGPLKNLERRG